VIELRGPERPVIVAVAPVRMMEVPLNEIIDVIAMLHLFVPAVRTVGVIRGMRTAFMIRRAAVRIRSRHLQRVVVAMIAMHMM